MCVGGCVDFRNVHHNTYRRLLSTAPSNDSNVADRLLCSHDDVIKRKHFPRYWPFVRRIHRSPVNSSHKGQWRAALMFSLICFWINGWVNIREAGDLRRYRTHYDVTVMRRNDSSVMDMQSSEANNDSTLTSNRTAIVTMWQTRLLKCREIKD